VLDWGGEAPPVSAGSKRDHCTTTYAEGTPRPSWKPLGSTGARRGRKRESRAVHNASQKPERGRRRAGKSEKVFAAKVEDMGIGSLTGAVKVVPTDRKET